MADVFGTDPLDIRVLAALTTGAATAADVAMRTGQPLELVAPVLTRSVAEQTVTLLGRGRTPAYSLTPKGLHAVTTHQGVQQAVDGLGHVDPAGAAPMVTEEYVAADDAGGARAGSPQPEPVQVSPAPGRVTWRHVVYAAAYVVLGLFFLLLQPVFGLVVIAAGLALGGYALRPLWRSASVRVTDD